MSPPSSGPKSTSSEKSSVSVGILLGLFDTKDGGNIPPKCRLTSYAIYGIISQKTGLFITTAVRIPTTTTTTTIIIIICGSRDSAVGIATGYGLDGQGVGVRVKVGARFFPSPRRSDRF
jgi:hypothetical protein